MAKFIAIYIETEDGGCGHYIGCGIALDEFEAENMAAAWKQVVKKSLLSDYDPDRPHQEDPHGLKRDVCQIRRIRLVQVAEENDTLYDEWYEEAVAAWDAKQNAKAEEKERAELERLKRKFE